MLGVAELGRRHVAVEPQDGEIGKWVGADELERELAPVDERRLARAVGSVDDVGGGEHEAVRRDDDAASCAVESPSAADSSGDAQVGDGRRQPLRDGGDDAGVGVERFGVGRQRSLRGLMISVVLLGADEPQR